MKGQRYFYIGSTRNEGIFAVGVRWHEDQIKCVWAVNIWIDKEFIIERETYIQGSFQDVEPLLPY